VPTGGVDIFAPGNIYSVDAIKADSTVGFSDDLKLYTGTSYASPFVAGVFALTWAANPSLTPTGLVDCVFNSAHTDSLTDDRRGVNALGAVSCAMGGTHPWVGIQQPAEGQVFERGVDRPVLVAESDDYEDGPPEIHWVSTLDGNLGSTSSEGRRALGLFDLSIGDHNICAQVTDSSARNWQDCRGVLVTSAKPVLEVVLPSEYSVVYVGQEIQLSAIAFDPDGPDPEVEWRISDISDVEWDDLITIAFGTEGTFTIPDWMAAGERHRMVVRATDETGTTGETRLTLDIYETPANLPPSIIIESPAQGETFESADGGPVAIRLAARVEDPEDGSIPLHQISWYFETDDGPSQSLPVTTNTRCEIYNPILNRCERYEVIHSFELTPNGSQTITRFRIYGEVRDSGGRKNTENNGVVIVYVSQLII
jgi:serine protease